MQITKEQLKAWNACDDGYALFESHFPEGHAEYQTILNTLADEDFPDYANWLMDRAGCDEHAVIEIDAITNRKHFFAAGSIVIKASAVVTWTLRAGGRIKAGERIKAGGRIKAGDGIEAGFGIEAGRGIEAGFGIEAGDGIEAGRGIKAGDGIEAGGIIEAGNGFGVFAGLRSRLTDWPVSARVIAKTKPNNLVSGSWVEWSEKATEEDA